MKLKACMKQGWPCEIPTSFCMYCALHGLLGPGTIRSCDLRLVAKKVTYIFMYAYITHSKCTPRQLRFILAQSLSNSVAVEMILLALLVVPLARAQFPAVCNTQDSLRTKTCCPDDCGSRGTCVSIREEAERSWNNAAQGVVEILRDGPPSASWPLDMRYQLPARVFERVCSCHVGWGGYDCSHCDFGFTANATGECVRPNTSQLRV